MARTLKTLQEWIGGVIEGDAHVPVTSLNSLDEARPGEVTFAEHRKYASKVLRCRASAIVVGEDFPQTPDKNLLRVQNPRAGFVKLMSLFERKPEPSWGIQTTASVSPKATLALPVAVGEMAVIREGTVVGENTVIESHVHVGANVHIGKNCSIGPNVVIGHHTWIGDRVVIHGGTVIGADGFGYFWSGTDHVKIPQIGDVRVEDDVEIGANVCVDRATLGTTVIGRGTKIDNLVQIAHNDVVGRDVIITGQVGLAGSARIGDRVIIGAQAGIGDHVVIGDDVCIGGRAGVTKNVKSGQAIMGFPAKPARQAKEELVGLSKLPELMRQFKTLSERLKTLEARLRSLENGVDR